MKGFSCCLKKDLYECLRLKKALIFALVSAGILMLVYCSAMMIPKVMDMLLEAAPDLVVGADIITAFIEFAFPSSVSGSIMLYSSDVMTFYPIVCIFLTAGLIPGEIKKHKWDAPFCKGYEPGAFVMSKALLYGLFTAVPSAICYFLYYTLICGVYADDFGIKNALFEGTLTFAAIFLITALTIFLSAACRHTYLAAVGIASFIFIGPDIFSLFTFEKYLPTYLIKVIRDNQKASTAPLISLMIMLVITAVVGFIAYKAPAVKKLRDHK